MKPIRRFVIAAVAASMVACATTPTFNDLAADAEAGAQLAQRSATAMLRAGKITVAQDQALQAQVKAVHDAIAQATVLHNADPAKGAAQLELAKAQLVELKARTGATQ